MNRLKLICIVFFLASWTASPGQERNLSQPVKAKEQTVPKAKEKKTDSVPLKTDKGGKTYQVIDGRKVLVDQQGTQSLARPEDAQPKKKEDTK